MLSTTTRVFPLAYPVHHCSLFEGPTKRIDLVELERHRRRSRRTEVTMCVPPPTDDDFDMRVTLRRPIFPPPPMRPVYPVKRDPISIWLVLVLFLLAGAAASLLLTFV
jgi:hypothetical protein